MMKHIQEAVRACLQAGSGIHTVCAPARHSGEYPLLAVDIREEGTVLVAGGTQAEQHYALTVTAAPDRMRQGEPALLGGLVISVMTVNLAAYLLSFLVGEEIITRSVYAFQAVMLVMMMILMWGK